MRRALADAVNHNPIKRGALNNQPFPKKNCALKLIEVLLISNYYLADLFQICANFF